MSDAVTTINDQELTLVTKQPLERNPAAVYLMSLSASGRRTQKTALDEIARMLAGDKVTALICNWAAVRYPHTAAIRTKLTEAYAPATANKMLSALRRVLKEAWKLGYMSAEEYQRAVSIANVPGQTLPPGRELDNGEIYSLMFQCASDNSPSGVRDAALIALLYSCGLRRAEITALDLDQVETETGKLLIQGKRNKQRTAYSISGTQEALADWLAIRGVEPGPLFLPITKGGNLRKQRLSTQAIYNILRKRAKLAQVKRFSPHDLRRTFVSDLLEAGADIAVVSRMAGHANIQTTVRYDRRPEEAKIKAAKLLHVPYHKRF